LLIVHDNQLLVPLYQPPTYGVVLQYLQSHSTVADKGSRGKEGCMKEEVRDGHHDNRLCLYQDSSPSSFFSFFPFFTFSLSVLLPFLFNCLFQISLVPLVFHSTALILLKSEKKKPIFILHFHYLAVLCRDSPSFVALPFLYLLLCCLVTCGIMAAG
jgi:hypothetical protein